MKWLARKFDYNAGQYTGNYWSLSDVDFFVDSDLGNDATGDGSSTKPYKTISKVKSLGAGSWADGKVIMVNGIFTENLTLDVYVRIVGCGGGLNGRAIFNNGTVRITIPSTKRAILDNIFFLNYDHTFNFIVSATATAYPCLEASNCIFNNIVINVTGAHNSARNLTVTTFFCSFNNYWHRANYTATNSRGTINYYGDNNTFYNTIKTGTDGGSNSGGWWIMYGKNNHINTDLADPATSQIVNSNLGDNNLINTDTRFFTDNTETVIAPLYFSPQNFNFNFPKTVSIWDKTAGATITTHPLFRSGTYNIIEGINSHIGFGAQGIDLDATDPELDDDENAIYFNLEKDGGDIYRSDGGSDGVLTTGYIDFTDVAHKVETSLNYSFAFDAGHLTRLIQESTGLTIRQGLDIILQYGNSTAAVDNCPELKIEYGKIVAVSGTGSSRKGNADPAFDENNYFFPSMRYVKLKIRFKSA
jgi:hypothetical protein